MKKKFNIKAGILSAAFIIAGATAALPAVAPQTVMAAESSTPKGMYEIVRKINIYEQSSDGSYVLLGTVPQTAYVSSKNMTYTFQQMSADSLLKGGLRYYKANPAVIPSVTASYGNNPADLDVYLSVDESKLVTETKTIKRNVKYTLVDSNGKKSDYGGFNRDITFTRYGYIDANGQKVMDAWSGEYTFPEDDVPAKTGYAPNMTKVPSKTVTPYDSDINIEVIYSQLPTQTQTKTVTRKINLIGKKVDGTTKSLGDATQTVTLSREVYTDTDGTVKVLRDWNSGQFKEYTLPEIDGYTKTQNKVAALQVDGNSKDTSVDVYYNAKKEYTIMYYLDGNSNASSQTTKVTYGTLTKTRTLSELNFFKANHDFLGWAAYREQDDTWYVRDSSGNKSFKKINGQLPQGYSFVLYKNGESVKATATSGVVHFVAQWKQKTYTVKYHSNDTSAASNKTTTVNYGTMTKTLTVSELGFKNGNKTFAGWKAYREVDDTWYLRDSNGKKAYKKLVNGKLPANHTYVLYANGESVKASAPRGIVHFYAQWK